MSVVISLLILMASHLDGASGYPSGATSGSCTNLNPSGHGASTASGNPPFNLTISSNSYQPGQTLEVTLSDTGSEPFKGFLLISKKVNGPNTEYIGSFSAAPNSHVICTTQTGNAVTHLDSSNKSSLTFNWTAPVTSAGDLIFHYTVVRASKSDYFLDIRSSVLQAAQPPPGQFFKDPQCGKTKGCYSNCFSNLCDWEMSWSDLGTQFDITIKAVVSGDNKYVALGFSNSSGMSPASVLACVSHSGNNDVQQSFNAGYSNTRLVNFTEGISNLTTSYTNGILQCSFLRGKISTNPHIYNLTEPWFVITAKGDSQTDGILNMHTGSDCFKMNNKVNLSSEATDETFSTSTTTSATVASSSTQAPPASKFPKDPECGKTKGCYSDCLNNLCNFLIAWKYSGSYFIITLKSSVSDKGDHYIALGFSNDKKMFLASVVSCNMYNGLVDAYSSYNPGHYNIPLTNPKEGLTNISGKYENGVLECTFFRNTGSATEPKFFNLTNEYYLIQARGKTDAGGLLENHDQQYSLTSGKVIFTDPSVDISMEATEYPLVKAHGCLMVIAWVLAASIGIALARFSKMLWPDTKWCDVKIWFAVHRGAMVVTFLMGIAGFILIFVEVEGYSTIVGEDYKKAHPILGIISTALLFINPFMSLLRCGPDHPRRPIFNWAHWAVGTSAHILAGITVALGLYLPKAQVDTDVGLIIMIVYGCWHIFFFIVMSVLDHLSKNTTTRNSHGLNVSGSQSKEIPFSASNELLHSFHKKLFLIAHGIVLTALTVVLLYLIIQGTSSTQ